MESNQTVRLAEDSDKKDVLSLLNGVFFKQQRSEKLRDDFYWNWKFKNSVFGPSILTVAEDDEKIVGVDNLWPWELSFQDDIIKAVQPCDTVVHEGYRGQGLFKDMRRYGLEEAVSRGYQMAFNFPNENSLPGNRSIGATYLGKINWWVKVLKPVHMVLDRFFHLKVESFNLSEEYQLDCEFLDQLAKKGLRETGLLQIHRKAGFHQWRYKNHPTRQYGMKVVREGFKELALIFTVMQQGARLEMVVVDIVGEECLKKSLIEAMVQIAKKLDVDFVAFMNNNVFGLERLWKNGFIKKSLKNMVVLPLNSGSYEEFCSFDNWNMVAGLHDSI